MIKKKHKKLRLSSEKNTVNVCSECRKKKPENMMFIDKSKIVITIILNIKKQNYTKKIKFSECRKKIMELKHYDRNVDKRN